MAPTIDLDSVCELAASLPYAEEGTWYGAPAFRVGGRVFARVHENDPDLFLIKVGGDERDALVGSAPSRFTLTAHPPERDESVLMRLSETAPRDLAEVRELLVLALRRVAPKRVLRDLDTDPT